MKLYRDILKAHKNRLPATMRQMGNDYVRNEFRQHFIAKPEFVGPFFTAWDEYLGSLQRKGGRFGEDLGVDVNALSDQQKVRLAPEQVKWHPAAGLTVSYNVI